MFLKNVLKTAHTTISKKNLLPILIRSVPSLTPILICLQATHHQWHWQQCQLKTKIKKTNWLQDQISSQKALALSPNNFLIAQRVAKTYALLAGIDENFKDEAQNIAEKLTQLAPNYPTTYLTNAKIYVILEDNKAAAS